MIARNYSLDILKIGLMFAFFIMQAQNLGIINTHSYFLNSIGLISFQITLVLVAYFATLKVIATKNFKLSDYLIERSFKIYPLYIFSVVLLCFLVFFTTKGGDRTFILIEFFKHLFLLAGITQLSGVGLHDWLWAITALTFIYVLTPLIVKHSFSQKRLFALFFTSMVIAYFWQRNSISMQPAPIFDFYGDYVDNGNFVSYFNALPNYLSSILAGILLAKVSISGRFVITTPLYPLAFLLVLSTGKLSSYVEAGSIINLFFISWFILSVAKYRLHPFIKNKLNSSYVKRISQLSYGFFIWGSPVLLIVSLIPNYFITNFILSLGITFGLSWLTFKFIEVHQTIYKGESK